MTVAPRTPASHAVAWRASARRASAWRAIAWRATFWRAFAWRSFAWLLCHGMCIATFSRVRLVDEGGLAALAGGEPLLIAANHQSHADTAILHASIPRARRTLLRFVASQARFGAPHAREPWLARVERWMLHGLAVHAYRAILVGGENSALRAVDSIQEAIGAGDTVVMYPEGSRSRDGRLAGLRPGVAMVAAARQVPIVPIRIDGTFFGLPPRAHFLRLGTRMTLRVRAPVVPRPGEDPAAIMARLRPLLECDPLPGGAPLAGGAPSQSHSQLLERNPNADGQSHA